MSDDECKMSEETQFIVDYILEKFSKANITITKAVHYGRNHRVYTITFEEYMKVVDNEF